MSDGKQYLHELIRLGTNALPPEHAPIHPDQIHTDDHMWQPGFIHVEPPPGYIFPVDAVQDLGWFLFAEEWAANCVRVAFLKVQHLPELVAEMFDDDGAAKPECVAQFGAAYDSVRSLMMQYEEFERLPPEGPAFCQDDWEYLRENQQTLQFWQSRAKNVLNQAIRRLCHHAAEGEISAVYRPKGGGRPEAIPSDWWQIDNPRHRIRACALNPLRPYDPTAPATAWFFFHKKEFEAALDRSREVKLPYDVPADGLGAVHLSPYVKLMIEVAQVTEIGPEPHQQVPVESLKITIQEIAERRGLEISERDLGKLATFIREPGMKAGGRKALADARRQASQGNG